MVTPAWLKNVELFSGLDVPQLIVILSYSSVESFPERKTIFNQGDEAHRLYIPIEAESLLTIKTGEKTDLMTSTIDKEWDHLRNALPDRALQNYNVTASCLRTSKVLMIETPLLGKRWKKTLKMGMEIMKKLASIYFNRLNEMREGVSKLLKVSKFKTS